MRKRKKKGPYQKCLEACIRRESRKGRGSIKRAVRNLPRGRLLECHKECLHLRKPGE